MIDIKMLIHYFTFVSINYYYEQMSGRNFINFLMISFVNNFTTTEYFN